MVQRHAVTARYPHVQGKKEYLVFTPWSMVQAGYWSPRSEEATRFTVERAAIIAETAMETWEARKAQDNHPTEIVFGIEDIG
jgi:hypothetical protein